MRALLASPTYGPVDPHCVSALRNAVMVASRRGVEWMGDLSPDRMKYSDARNYCATILAGKPGLADGIMWVDSDIDPPPDAILRLLHAVNTRGADFYSGVYHQRAGEHKPVFFAHVGNDLYKQYDVYEPNTVTPEGGCGFGFVWTSTQLIKDIEALPEFSTDRGGWFPDHQYSGSSEDLGFCTLARHANYQLFVDTGIQVGHMGPTEIITREHHLRSLTGVKGATKVQAG